MYSDDTHLTFASNDVVHLEEYMNDDLTRITEWLTANNRGGSRIFFRRGCTLKEWGN